MVVQDHVQTYGCTRSCSDCLMVANDLVQTASWLYKILFRLPDGSTGWCSDCLMVVQDLVQTA